MRTFGSLLCLIAIAAILFGARTSSLERQDRCPGLEAEMPDAPVIAGDIELSATMADAACTYNYEDSCTSIDVAPMDAQAPKGSGELEYSETDDRDNTSITTAARPADYIGAIERASVLKLPRDTILRGTSDDLSTGAAYDNEVAVLAVGV
jgi:hypothetical protein